MKKHHSNMFEWKLSRPLAVFDIEATGTNIRSDRIVELAIIRILPDGKRESRVFRINPGIPIPREATAIHGISDKDVADAPPFREVAPEIVQLLADCDLAGFNVLRFDIPLLTEEFARVDIKFDVNDRNIIDAQRIYHQREPRDLTAALAFYAGEMLLGAHGAEADAQATIRVLEGQFEKYSDLPRDMAELSKYCDPRDPTWADRTGRLKWENDEIVLNFGKKKGTPLSQLIVDDPGFIKWMMKSDFPRDTQELIANAVEGRWPNRPG